MNSVRCYDREKMNLTLPGEEQAEGLRCGGGPAAMEEGKRGGCWDPVRRKWLPSSIKDWGCQFRDEPHLKE